jgi:DHA1 family bicyclomycin/chloramphenicol resistance-like MFS transporter
MVPASTRPSSARLAIILGMCTALNPISVDMYLSAMPQMQADLNGSPAAIQQTLSVFLLGMALAQILFGPLSDHYGRKRPLLTGIGLFVLASIGCATAASMENLIATRMAQAIGGAAGMVTGRAVARDYFEGTDLARMFSLIALVMGCSPIFAPLVGSVILLFAGWRAIFWTLAAYGLVLFAAVAFGLRESLPPARRSHARIGASFAELLRVGTDRRFFGYAIAMAFAMGSTFTYIVSSPIVFISHYGFTPGEYAALFGANGLAMVAAAQTNVRLLRRWPSATILRWVLRVEFTLALALLAIALSGVGGAPAVAIGLFLLMGCSGLISPNAAALAMTPFGHSAGAASALLGVLHGTAGGIATAAVGYLPGAGPVPMALMMVMLVGLALLAISMIAPAQRAVQAPAAATKS